MAFPAAAVQPDEVCPTRCWRSARAISPRACAASSAATNPSTNRTPNWPATCAFWCANAWSPGDSDEEVVAYIVDRYGEFVLLRPPMTGSTIALWLAAPALMLLGLGLSVAYVRRRSKAAAPTLRRTFRRKRRAAEGNPPQPARAD
jgi:cytochrome c-type biogenesis protein CcmH